MQKLSVTITSKTLWNVLFMALGVLIAWKLKNFLMVVLLSVVLASFVEVGTRVLKKLKIPRIVSVIFIYALGSTIVIGLLYLVVPLFTSEIQNFVTLFPKTSYLYQVLNPIASHGLSTGTIKTIFSGGTDLLATLGGIFGSLINVILVIIISFYLAAQEKGIEQFLRVVTPDEQEDYVVGLWARVERKIGYWFGGQVLVAILVGMVTYIGLFIMGVPYALILSALAGFFVFVPFGTALSLAPAVALGYLGGGVGLALQIFIFYGIVHYLESYFLSPYVLHRTIGMPMLVIILAAIACFELFGLVGIVISIPLAVLILELLNDNGSMPKDSRPRVSE
jgi:predicted PurR-regulated permease PerM